MTITTLVYVTSTSRACAARDGAITSQTEMLLWEHDSTSLPALPVAGYTELMKATSCSLCLPTSSAGPQFSITHHIRCPGKQKETQLIKDVCFE